MMNQQVLEFYSDHAAMTFAGKYAPLIDALPDEMPTLARIVQGLAIHEYVASSFYGVTIPETRKNRPEAI